MSLNFNELLPDSLSDKEAHHLADFLMEIALAFESHYYVQIRRYGKTKEREELSKQYINDKKYPS